MSSESKSTPADPIELTEQAGLGDVVSTHDVVLVDFHADWCGPCRMVEPTIEGIASDTDAAVLKIDVDRFQGLASQHGVQSIPTLLVFAGGEPVERLVGMQTDEQLSSLLEEYTG